LTPSDFCLFEHVKQLLRGYEFADREALFYLIEDILRRIEKVILEDVFLRWMERLHQCDSAAGEYVELTMFFANRISRPWSRPEMFKSSWDPAEVFGQEVSFYPLLPSSSSEGSSSFS
jgi:hypothetical protein